MRILKLICLTLVISYALTSCQEPVDYTNAISGGQYFHQAQNRITEVIIHDIFSPPVAARIYSYPSLAAYEVAAASDPTNYTPLMGQLNGSEPIQLPVPENVYPPLAALAAYYQVGTTLIFSEEKMNEHRDAAFAELKNKGIPDDVFDASVNFGKEVAAKVLEYAKKDNFNK